MKITGGGVSRKGVSRRGRGRGAGRVSAVNWGIAGEGLNIFFRGRSVHQGLDCVEKGGIVRGFATVHPCRTFSLIERQFRALRSKTGPILRFFCSSVP